MFILYVADQKRSRNFYSHVLQVRPVLDVPGMTEFILPGGGTIGLMPERGIVALLGEKIPDPATASGIPRSELYLRVESPEEFHHRVLESGGREIEPVKLRDWGDRVAYSLDPDGHVLAFAK